MSRSARQAMIERDHRDLSLSRQCQVLSISRSSLYCAPKGERPANLTHHVTILEMNGESFRLKQSKTKNKT